MSYTIIEVGVAPTTVKVVRRDSDGAFIPEDPNNSDRQAYQAWLEAGDALQEPMKPASADPREASA